MYDELTAVDVKKMHDHIVLDLVADLHVDPVARPAAQQGPAYGGLLADEALARVAPPKLFQRFSTPRPR